MSKLMFVLATSAALCAVACKKDASKSEPATGDKPAEPAAGGDKPAEAKAAPPAALTEVDLSKFGDDFKGYVAQAPATAKIEFDDPSRQIVLSDEDFISISEAGGWDDAMKGLESDKDNKNIKKISDTEYQWERTPPLGTAWNVDVKVTVNDKVFSCNTGMTGTFTSAAMRDQIAAICKSIKKK